MKRKTLTLTLCLLACFAVIGVGFAAWIITSDAEKTVTGNIKVETVEDHRLKINIISTEADNVIRFGKPVGYAANSWILNNEAETENLTATIKFTITKGNEAVTNLETAGITVTAGFTTTITDDMNKGVGNNSLVTIPTGFTVEKDSTDSEGKTFMIKVVFSYGDEFGKKNPYEFYKDKDVTAEGDNAVNNLGKLFALNGVTYTLTISAKNNK